MNKKRFSLMMVVLLLSFTILAGCTGPIAKNDTAEQTNLAETGRLMV